MATTADDVRRLALALPSTTEKLAWGMPTFRVAGKIFVWLGEDDASMGMKCPIEERAELIQAEPDKFFLREGHDDTGNWIRVHLSAVDDEDELRAMVVDAWRLTAPRRLAAEHGEPGVDS
ncbi:MmcQ/YjbR family DNA-binding protein [Embleya sp. NPDC001921]